MSTTTIPAPSVEEMRAASEPRHTFKLARLKVKRTPAEKLAALDAERAKLEKLLEAQNSPERTEALELVVAAIGRWSFTKAELAVAWPRKRAFAPRKKKAAAPAAPDPAGVSAGMASR